MRDAVRHACGLPHALRMRRHAHIDVTTNVYADLSDAQRLQATMIVERPTNDAKGAQRYNPNGRQPKSTFPATALGSHILRPRERGSKEPE